MARARKFIRAEITRHGKRVYYFRRDQERVRLPDEYGTDEFNRAYDMAVKGTPIVIARNLKSPAKGRRGKIETACAVAIKNAKARARAKGWKFELPDDWALRECQANGYRCSLTGVPFLSAFDGETHKRPYVPSIDRIDCKQGYTPDNVRLVIFAVNLMMAEWGEDIMHRVANGYRYVRNKKRRA